MKVPTFIKIYIYYSKIFLRLSYKADKYTKNSFPTWLTIKIPVALCRNLFHNKPSSQLIEQINLLSAYTASVPNTQAANQEGLFLQYLRNLY